jgi:decaprenylphospho-beta-D-ribofuranose 2-oxidase
LHQEMAQGMNLHSWGNYPRHNTKAIRISQNNNANRIFSDYSEFIPYGNGRSYGDSALNDYVLNLRTQHYFLEFNPLNGQLRCQAGVLLSEIIDVFLPRGWFLQTTPGTKFITVGGAIAGDVHGKNHHVAGCFSEAVVEFQLILPNGDIKNCSKQKNTRLFQATCGGMGLTGIIAEATIQLKPVTSCEIDQNTIKNRNLEETFSAFESNKNYSYSVAWIDCLSSKKNLGRSILTVGEHATNENLQYTSEQLFSVPFTFPGFVLNKYSTRLFNNTYYWLPPKGISKQKTTIDKFFYPLDAIGRWNRIYGKRGFTQYQFVLPLESSYEGLKSILIRISEAGMGSFLAVLKLLGKANENWLSFPMEGYTLALDFKIESRLFPLLNELDAIVLDHGGRFYLAKDARLSEDSFAVGYSKIGQFRELRKEFGMDQKLQSLQSKRLKL